MKIKLSSLIDFWILSRKLRTKGKLFILGLKSFRKIKIKMDILTSSTPWLILEPEIINFNRWIGLLSNSKLEESLLPFPPLPVALLPFKPSNLSNISEDVLLT